MSDTCARCGFPRKEHSYNGACYGLCGKFEEPEAYAADNERLRGVEQFVAEAARHERDGLRADNERLTALLREAVLYDSQIIHMESWWRKARRALEPKP